MRYSLRQLEVFLGVARHENVSRAAQGLAMSQSAASSALKELEGQFGVQLFDRVGKRLQLSELGHELRPQAERLLDQAQAFEAALAGDLTVGHLNIGATLTIGNYVTVPMIAQFKKRFAQAQINLQVANTQSIAHQVASFDLDMGMIEGELHHSALQITHWRADELVVFAHPRHPLAGVKAVDDDALMQQSWILREPGSGTRQAFDRAMQGILSDLHIDLELQHTEAIKRAVEAGLGVGCLSRICLQDAFERGTLVPIAVPGRDFKRQWYLITHREKFHGAALKQWLQLCHAS